MAIILDFGDQFLEVIAGRKLADLCRRRSGNQIVEVTGPPACGKQMVAQRCRRQIIVEIFHADRGILGEHVEEKMISLRVLGMTD